MMSQGYFFSTESQELKEIHKTTWGFSALKWGSIQVPESDLESSDFFELNIAIPAIWLAQTGNYDAGLV
jgi:hypothetical protein